jgi:hypothetical protein
MENEPCLVEKGPKKFRVDWKKTRKLEVEEHKTIVETLATIVHNSLVELQEAFSL